jgi:hypothetical protein
MSQLFIYPSSAGDETNQTPYPTVANYLNIDEVTPDDFATFNYSISGSLRDLYQMQNTGLPSDTIINWIRVYMRILTAGYGTAKTAIKSGGVVYEGKTETTPGVWEEKYTHYTTIGGSAITVAMLDSIQAGCTLHGLSKSELVHNTRTRILIDYGESGSSAYTLYFGETDYDEQSKEITSIASGSWVEKSWDVSDIAASDRNAVKKFGVKIINSTTSPQTVYLDYINAPSTGDLQKIFVWEKIDTTSNDYTVQLYPWEPIYLESYVADTSLGTEVLTNHNRPPLGSFVFGPSLTGMCFIIYNNFLYYCLEKQPDYWPTEYNIEVSPVQFPLKAGCFYDGQIYVASTEQIYNISGTGADNFSPPIPQSALTGTISPYCFLPIHGKGIFHLGNDGLYLFTGSDDVNVTNERFRPIFTGETVLDIPGISTTNTANSWLIYFQSKLYFGYPKDGSTYPDNIIVTDLSTGKSAHYDYGQTFRCVGIDYENDRLLTVDTSGYVWELENKDTTTDDGDEISFKLQTMDYSSTLRKYFPRWARYDVNVGTGATASGFVLLDGVSVQTHTLSGSRNTKKRLIAKANGDRVSMRITGTGQVDIYSVEVE